MIFIFIIYYSNLINNYIYFLITINYINQEFKFLEEKFTFHFRVYKISIILLIQMLNYINQEFKFLEEKFTFHFRVCILIC